MVFTSIVHSTEPDPAKQANGASRSSTEDATRTVPTVERRPQVLVLLASYNGGAWIGEQIESILAQKEVDVHVIVRDDGSTDGTRTRVAQFAHRGSISLTVAEGPGRS